MRLFDLHCDTLTKCEQQHTSLYSNDFHWDSRRASALFERSFQVTAVYVNDEIDEKDAWNYVDRVLLFLETEQERWDTLHIINSAGSLDQCRHGALPAIENGVAIGADLSRIAALAKRGIVYITLTWNGQNRLGNGCFSQNRGGLTAFGKAAVEEMYGVGILPDVSHLNEAGFWDVADSANGRPFLASHSVSDAVFHHPRNLTDAQFIAVKESGGLVGLNLCGDQLGAHSFVRLERHLCHFLELGGESTVALGMDLDGTDLPDDWHGIETAVRFYEYLLAKRYPDRLIDKLFFKNSHAFFMKTLTSRDKCIRIGT